MNDILFEVLTSIVALAAGAAWYKEFIARRKAEADLAVAKRMKELADVDHKLEINEKVFNELRDKYGSSNAANHVLSLRNTLDRSDTSESSTGRSDTKGDPDTGSGGV